MWSGEAQGLSERRMMPRRSMLANSDLATFSLFGVESSGPSVDGWTLGVYMMFHTMFRRDCGKGRSGYTGELPEQALIFVPL